MNPLLLRLIPFAVSAIAGFAIAWWIQGLRVTSAEQGFVDYKQEQVALEQKRKDDADKKREESARRYADTRAALEKEIEAGDVFRRCVLAGRCGVPRNPSGVCESSTSRSGGGLSAPNKPDGSSANAIPLAGDATAINDCAVTTLQLNHLQQDIEEQPGYSQ